MQDATGKSLGVLIKQTSKLNKIFGAVEKNFQIDLKTCRFSFDGEVLDAERTPKDYNMQDDDIIIVF